MKRSAGRGYIHLVRFFQHEGLRSHQMPFEAPLAPKGANNSTLTMARECKSLRAQRETTKAMRKPLQGLRKPWLALRWRNSLRVGRTIPRSPPSCYRPSCTFSTHRLVVLYLQLHSMVLSEVQIKKTTSSIQLFAQRSSKSMFYNQFASTSSPTPTLSHLSTTTLMGA